MCFALLDFYQQFFDFKRLNKCLVRDTQTAETRKMLDLPKIYNLFIV